MPWQALPADLAIHPAAFDALGGAMGPALMPVINSLLGKAIAYANTSCQAAPPPKPPKQEDETESIGLFVLFVTAGVSLVLTVALVGFSARRWRRADEAARGELAAAMLGSAQEEAPEPCLAMCPAFASSRTLQVAVPLILLGIMGIFAASAAGPGAAVRVGLSIAGEELDLDDMFMFTLLSSVSDMCNAGAIALGVLIALLSGVWPYLKLLLMLYCWWAPVCWLPVAMRELMLRVLDAAGKWSLLDFLMLEMMSVAFHFSITLASNEGPGQPPDVIDVRVFVYPGLGTAGFIFAACLSLASSHVLLAMHRTRMHDGSRKKKKGAPASKTKGRYLDVDAAMVAAEPGDGGAPAREPYVPLCRHKFAELMYTRGLRLPMWVQVGVPLLLVACGVATMGVSAMNAFTLHFEGMIGGLLGPDARTESFSLFSLNNKLAQIGTENAGATMQVLPYIFIILTLGVPMLWLLLLLLLWVVPLPRTAQVHLLNVTEVLQAWSTLDVFLLTIVTSLLELKTFAGFIVGGICGSRPRLEPDGTLRRGRGE